MQQTFGGRLLRYGASGLVGVDDRRESVAEVPRADRVAECVIFVAYRLRWSSSSTASIH